MADQSVALRIKAIVEGLNDVGGLIKKIEELGGSSDTAAALAAHLGKELADLSNKQKLVDQFTELKTELQDTSKSLETSAARTATLARELKATENPSKSLTREFANARKETRALADQEQRQGLALQDLRKQMGASGIESKKLALSQREISQAVAQTEGRMQGLKQRLSETRDQAAAKMPDPTKDIKRGAQESATSVESLSESIKRTTMRMVGWVAAAVGLNKIRSGIAAILETGGRFESLEVRLTALMGSLEAGQQATAWIQDFAKNTPLQLGDVTEAFARLKTFGLDPMDGTMQSLVDANAKMGGSQETLQRIILGVGQAWTKQKLQGQEIMQLMEAGIPVWDLLSKAMGKNVVELQKLSAQGKIGRTEISLLIDEIGRSSQGAAAAQMATWTGLVSNLKDTWSNFLNSIAKSGVLDFFKRQVQDVLDTTARMASDGSLQRMATATANAIVSMAKVIKGTVVTLYEFSGVLALTAKAIIAVKLVGLVKGFADLALKLSSAVTPALVGTGAAATGAAVKMGLLARVMSAIPKNFAIALAVVGIDVAVRGAEWLGEAIAKISPAGKIAEQALQRLSDEARRNLDVSTAAAAANEKFADTKIKSSEEIIKLSARERAAYAEAIQGAEKYHTAILVTARTQEILGENTKEIQDAAIAALAELRTAYADIEKSTLAAANSAATLSPQVTELVDQFRSLAAEGKGALDALLKPLDPASLDSVKQITQALDELLAKGELTSTELSAGLRETIQKLGAEDLTKLRVIAKSTFDEMGQGGAAVAAVLKATTQAALQGLGVDLGEITTGLKKNERAALDSFGVIATGLEDLGLDAKQSARVLQESLIKALEDIKSKQGVQALRDSIIQLGRDGELSGKQVSQALADMDKAAATVAGSLDKVGEAGKSAGEKTQEGMKTAEDATKRSSAAINEFAARLASLSTQEARQLGDELVLAFERGIISAAEFEGKIDQVRLRINALATAGEGISAALAKPIKAAREEFAKFGDEAAQEFDRVVQGDEATIEERDFQRRLQELEALNAAAKASKDSSAKQDALEAIDLLKQVHAKRMENIAAEAAAQQQRDAEAAARETATNSTSAAKSAAAASGGAVARSSGRIAPQSAQAAQVSKVVRIEWPTRAGVARGDFPEADAARLLDALQNDAQRA